MPSTDPVIVDRIAAYVATLNTHYSSPIPRAHLEFGTVVGRRYVKVVRMGEGGHPGSVHAFVDRASGEVFKPAGWAQPAPHARFALLDAASFTALLEHAAQPHAYAGGYLYIR